MTKVNAPRRSKRLLAQRTSNGIQKPRNNDNDKKDVEDVEIGELIDLSADNVEWSAADDIDSSRYHSYDSRYERGNEEYTLDGFVVEDGEFEEETESTNEQSEDEEIKEGEIEDEDLTGDRRVSSATESTQRSSGSSKLFYSDPDDPISRPQSLASWSQLEDLLEDPVESLEPLIDLAGADIVEEVMDAFSLFSRRCNRDRAPLRLRLAAAVLEDEEVRETLEWAVQLGLGRKLSLEDGSKRWTIGPKVS